MSIVSRISQFASSSLIGFGQGFQPVCGFNYGAKRYDRVMEAFWFCVKVATCVLFVIAVLGFCFASPLISLFRKDDLQVISIGAKALRLQCIALPLTGWVIMNNMMTQTIGKTFRASLLAAADREFSSSLPFWFSQGWQVSWAFSWLSLLPTYAPSFWQSY